VRTLTDDDTANEELHACGRRASARGTRPSSRAGKKSERARRCRTVVGGLPGRRSRLADAAVRRARRRRTAAPEQASSRPLSRREEFWRSNGRQGGDVQGRGMSSAHARSDGRSRARSVWASRSARPGEVRSATATVRRLELPEGKVTTHGETERRGRSARSRRRPGSAASPEREGHERVQSTARAGEARRYWRMRAWTAGSSRRTRWTRSGGATPERA